MSTENQTVSNNEIMIIPTNVLQALVDYLAARPFNEVAHLIKAVGDTAQKVQLPPAPEASAPATTEA